MYVESGFSLMPFGNSKRRRIGPFHAENPPAQAGKMRFDSVLFRRAAVRVTRRPQAGEARQPGDPVGQLPPADRRESSLRAFFVRT